MWTAAAVGLDENTNSISAAGIADPGYNAGSGAGATFEFVANHAGTATDASLVHRAAVRALDGVGHMLRFNVKAIDVVEPAIPRLGHNR